MNAKLITIFAGIYWLSAPLVIRSEVRLVGTSTGTRNSGGVQLKAADDFVGNALVMSSNWIDNDDYWHFAELGELVIDCRNKCDYGAAIHKPGENSLLRRIHVTHANKSGIISTGARAPFRITDCVSNNNGQFGYDFALHPHGFPSNSGKVSARCSGDDNGTALVHHSGGGWCDLNLKSEGNRIALLIDGDYTGGGSLQVDLKGELAPRDQPDARVVELGGTATPHIEGYCFAPLFAYNVFDAQHGNHKLNTAGKFSWP